MNNQQCWPHSSFPSSPPTYVLGGGPSYGHSPIKHHPIHYPTKYTPFNKLFNKQPLYGYFRVFGFLHNHYLNNIDKLQPRSFPCIFLYYLSHDKGYHYLNLHTKQIIISRHIVFDESIFPFVSMTPITLPIQFSHS